MPIKQLRIVEKIKFLISNNRLTKKQIVNEVKEDAKEHRLDNQTQEREDEAKVDHAVKELRDENRMEDSAYSRLANMLAISLLINLIFLAALILLGIFFFM